MKKVIGHPNLRRDKRGIIHVKTNKIDKKKMMERRDEVDNLRSEVDNLKALVQSLLEKNEE